MIKSFGFIVAIDINGEWVWIKQGLWLSRLYRLRQGAETCLLDFP